MKKIYMEPQVKIVVLAAKRPVMLTGSVQTSGLTGTTKEEWDPSDDVDW